jgi:hypothetical protein
MSYCWERNFGNVFTWPLPSNGHVRHIIIGVNVCDCVAMKLQALEMTFPPIVIDWLQGYDSVSSTSFVKNNFSHVKTRQELNYNTLYVV